MKVDPADNGIRFGPWLKRRRTLLDLTQDELAQRAICSLSTIRKLERNELIPSKELARILAAALDIPETEQDAFIAFARDERTSPLPGERGLPTIALPAAMPSSGAPAPSTAATQPAQPNTTITAAVTAAPYRPPAQLTELIGREWELLACEQRLQQPGVRLLTLYGPPGAGKTRLALALAHALQPHFSAGVCFVPLATISDAALVMDTIARAVGAPANNAATPLLALQTFLQTSQLLLVLDNFEQVVSAADQLSALLEAAPALKLLVTSRTLLKLYGEHEFLVPPLALPDLQNLPSAPELLRYPAIALFVERARASQHTFHLSTENAAVLAQICTRLDGLPLALEMAAARIKLQPPALILKQLHQRSGDLSSGLRNLLPRQQSLRNAITWSYALLGAEEQHIFNLLGVFVGGCTDDALTAVCATVSVAFPTLPTLQHIAERLHGLSDHSLLQIQIDREGETRYTILEVLREYACERLVNNKHWQTAKRAHAHYFAQWAEQAVIQLQGHEQRQWLTRLAQEHDNLRAALAWCHEEDVSLGLQMATALSEFWFVRSYFAEGSGQLLRLLAQPTAPKRGLVRARALCAAGYLVERRGNYSTAQAMLNESLALCQAEGDQIGIAKALYSLGLVAFYQHDYHQAQSHYGAALAIYRTLGDLAASAAILSNWGQLAKDQGDYPQAMRHLEEGLAVAQQLGNLYTMGRIYNSLALVTFWQGEFDRSAHFSTESLALHRQLGDKHGMGYALENLGAVANHRGDPVTATRHITEALLLFREIDDKVGILIALDDLGVLAAYQGQMAEAAHYHRQSLRLAWQIQEKRYIAFALERLAFALGAADLAVKLYAAAAVLRTTIGAPIAPIDRHQIDAALTTLRAHLGETLFTNAWQRAVVLPLEQMVTLALQPV